MEEKRFLLEVLGSNKKKSVKELVKKLHLIDLPGGLLDKALKYYFDRLLADYYDRFNMWRITYFNGGLLNVPMANNLQKDPIIESIQKGTDIVQDEKTAEKSYERRQEKRRQEIADIAAARKSMGHRKTIAKNPGSNTYNSPIRGLKTKNESMSPGRG